MRKLRTIVATALSVTLLTAAPVLATNHNVAIQGMKFRPANITVAAGDTITFTNNDSAPHTATAGDGSFDTGRLGKGESARVTIRDAGSTDYICRLHPMMKGKVTAR